MLSLKVFILLCCFANFCTNIHGDEIYDYEVLINKTIANALTYKLDTDARRYQANNTEPENFGSFDFVIIGGGAAGAVIAARLSEVTHWKVLLLEAGTFGNNVTDIPAMLYPTLLSDLNWGFYTVPQENGCLGMVDHRCPYPRGRGVGGSSLANAVMSVRGNPADYKEWVELGNKGWSYEEMTYYFKNLETFDKNFDFAVADWKYHGTNGKLGVEYHVFNNSREEIFVEGHEELGFPSTDYNSPRQLGPSPVQFFEKHARRQDTGTTYIKPILSRKNLVVSTFSYVTKIDIDKKYKTAKGVYFSKNNKLFYVKAKKEVILSAGAFQSPQILMLSGIGPQDHLKQNNIEVITNLPVGNNLKEHASTYIYFTDNFTETATTLREDIQDYLNGGGLLSSSRTFSYLSFLKANNPLNPNPKRPDIEVVLVPKKLTSVLDTMGTLFRYTDEFQTGFFGPIAQAEAFTMQVIYLHPKSSGTVRLQSNDPYDYPLIDLNLLSATEDLDGIYAGLQEIFKLADTKAFRKLNAKKAKINLCESLEEDSEEFWKCFIKQSVYPYYHPTGTCRMGPDPKNYVVDNELNVHGIKKLRVADASVIPITVSGHTVAATMAIGEKVSHLIKKTHL